MNPIRVVKYIWNLDRHLTDRIDTYDCCRIERVVAERVGDATWVVSFYGRLLKKDGTSRQYASFKQVYPSNSLRDELADNYIWHAKCLEQEYCRAQS